MSHEPHHPPTRRPPTCRVIGRIRSQHYHYRNMAWLPFAGGWEKVNNSVQQWHQEGGAESQAVLDKVVGRAHFWRHDVVEIEVGRGMHYLDCCSWGFWFGPVFLDQTLFWVSALWVNQPLHRSVSSPESLCRHFPVMLVQSLVTQQQCQVIVVVKADGYSHRASHLPRG